MKLLQSYSNSLSIDLSGNEKPILPSQFYPTPDKYIVIQNSSGMPHAKDYDLWQNVIDTISPFLEKEGIQILQIGSGEVKPLSKVINLINQTNFSKSVYIIQNSLLVISNDSFSCHVAADSIPIVSLYGSTSIEAHSPYKIHANSKLLESHRWGNRPSYQAQENPKTVNLIDFFEVARAILDILNISHNIKSKSLYVGNNYFQQIIETIPDFLINDPNFLPGTILSMRCDYFFNEPLIYQNLQIRKYAIHTNRPLNIDILKQLKHNIACVIYEINDQHNRDFCKNVIKAGIPLSLISYEKEEWVKTILLEYLDGPLIQRIPRFSKEHIYNKIAQYTNTPVFEVTNNISQYINEHTKFKTSKLLLSNQQWYMGKSQWKIHNNCDPLNLSSRILIDDHDWVQDQDFYLVYNE